MSKEQLIQRLLSSVANIDSQRMRSGFLEEMDFARIAPAMQSPRTLPCSSTTRPASAPWSCAPRPAASGRTRLDLLIVDYLQLMQATSNSRDSTASRSVGDLAWLKSLARELKVPVIALSQLSRQPRCASRANRA